MPLPPAPLLPKTAQPAAAVAPVASSESAAGLPAAEARRRLLETGPNVLATARRESWLRMAARQFQSLTVLVLAGAAAVSAFSGDAAEAVAIGAVVLLNAAIGFGLEWQARASMDALHALDVPQARALRDGQPQLLPAADLVPGDVLLLEGGDVVPADADLLEAHQLQINESALTGESLPVGKVPGPAAPDAPLAEQRQRVFKGTAVVDGNGRALVVATGMGTELGRITRLVQATGRPPTPLEGKLDVLARQLLLLTGGLTLGYGLLVWAQGRPLGQVLKTAIVLAVAAIPEGLSIVATLALAAGTLRMARHKVLVKRLPAVETLGSTGVIVTDKTGTLTQNRIEAHTVWLADGCTEVRLQDDSLSAVAGGAPGLLSSPGFAHLQLLAALCNNATYHPTDPGRTTGDPLEIALWQLAGATQGAAAPPLRLAEQAFRSDTRLMGTVHQLAGGRCLVAVKGAAEAVLPHCRYQWAATGAPQPLSAEDRAAWVARAEGLAARGLRTLAFASAEWPGHPGPDFVRELEWVGLVAFLDPPRLEVAPALAACRAAGIRVIVATGDHPATARTVARQVGLLEDEEPDGVILGAELADLLRHPNGAGRRRLHRAQVFARMSPAQKLDLIAFYQQHGQVVGMTGDGVNDAPALRRADIGIAMGLRGTQVAAEAADLVLQDDAFGSIVVAIAQGRVMLANIRTFLSYLISCNLSEVLIVTLVALLHPKVPLWPLQILFLNLLTDVFPALALALGPGHPNLMQRPPRSPHKPLLGLADWRRAGLYAAALTAGGAGAFACARWEMGLSAAVCNNVVFYGMALGQLLHVFNFAADRRTLLRSEVTRNWYVWGALALCSGAMLTIYLVPALRPVFGLVPLPPAALVLVLASGLLPLLLIQAGRWLRRVGRSRTTSGRL
ncbi:cation-transporting P-type ATPase [Hymenobacter sp. 5317J-9]|uniref:cation-translocating P-type ATPase n=1 Tax=Hymenobacter sp. 5317J-9 TaxID=2932250 RepID=UPI001FD63436|nr:cation-transporting P-type ATPase [Hymenobacter sp. 5317J-9]UOQ96503.1 cation-transporting P-type ATPase [Hymenobacter sp. 5317J-9]